MHLMKIFHALYVLAVPLACLLALSVVLGYVLWRWSLDDLSPQEDEEASPDENCNKETPAVPAESEPYLTMYYTNTFAPWPSCVHRDNGQYARYLRSKSEDIRLNLSPDQTYEIIGTSGRYKTSLRSCTCPDFGKNQHGGAPCKHIYFLARHCNVDVDGIFEDYLRYGRNGYDKEHSGYRR